MGEPTPHEDRFSENVFRVRRAKLLSQEDLAKAAGMTRNAIQGAESGTRRIRLEEACNIAAALDIPLTDLISAGPLLIHLPATTESTHP